MVTVLHPDCGEQVRTTAAGLVDAGGGRHLCRDYLAWYGPPDRRDPFVVDVPDGWAPKGRLDLAA